MAIIRNSDGSVTVSGRDSASGTTTTIGGSPPRTSSSGSSSNSSSGSSSSGSSSNGSSRPPTSPTGPETPAEGAYTGDYDDPNRPPTPFEQLQSRSGSFYESSRRNYEKIEKTATYNPEGLSKALDSPIDQPQVLKANLQQAYNVANERASQTASNRLLQQSAVGDLIQIGFLNSVPVVKDYTSSGNPIYQTDENGNVVQRLVIGERAKNLYEKEGYKGFYEFEERAIFGKSLDFIVGENDEVSIFPQGTREQLKQAGLDRPYFVNIDNREYLVAQKEGKDTIKLAAIDIYQNKVETPKNVPFTELLDKSQYTVTPNAELTYSLDKGEFNIQGTGVSKKQPEVPNIFKTPLELIRPATSAPEQPKQETNLLEAVFQVGSGEAARDLGVRSSSLYRSINQSDIETAGGKFLYQTLRSADIGEKTVEGFEIFASKGSGPLEQLGGGLVAGIARTGLGLGETFVIGPATIIGGSAAAAEKLLTGKGNVADLQVYLSGQGFSASGLATSARDLPLFGAGDIISFGVLGQKTTGSIASKLGGQKTLSDIAPRVSTSANFAIYETGREIYSNEPLSAEKIAGAATVGFVLGGPILPKSVTKSIPKLGDVPLKTTEGTTKIYQGLYLNPTEGKVIELIGKTEKGIVIGKPAASEFPSLSKVVLPEQGIGKKNVVGNPEFPLETSILSSPEAMKAQGFTPVAIERTQITKEVLTPLKDQPSAYGPFELPKQTEVLSQKEVSAVLDYTRAQGREKVSYIGGSFGSMSQRNPTLSRVPGDIDVHVFGGATEAEQFAVGATKSLKDIGSDAVLNIEKSETSVKVMVKVRGEKAIEVLSEKNPADALSPFIEGKNRELGDYRLGFNQDRPKLEISGLPTVSLSEQSIRKGTAASNFYQSKTSFYSYLELDKKGIFEQVRSGRTKIAEPPLHRSKDLVDFYADTKTLAESARFFGSLSEQKVAAIESKLTRYKEISFEIPGVKEKFAELDASIAQKEIKVDYTSAVFDTPSTSTRFQSSVGSPKLNEAFTFSSKSPYSSGRNRASETYPSYYSSSNKDFSSYLSPTSSKSSPVVSTVSPKSPSPSIKSPGPSPYILPSRSPTKSPSTKSSINFSTKSPTNSLSSSISPKSGSLEFETISNPPPKEEQIKPFSFDFGINTKEPIPKKKRKSIDFYFAPRYTPSVAGISLTRKVKRTNDRATFSGLEIRGVPIRKKFRGSSFI